MNKNLSLICLLAVTLMHRNCFASSRPPCIPSWGQWQLETTPGLAIRFLPPGDQSGTVNVSACAPRFTNAFTSLQEFNCGESPSDSVIFDSNSVSVIWTASGCGASPAAGTGTNAVFTVSTAGSCTVAFTVDASTISDPYWAELGLPAMPSWEFSSTAAQTFNVNPLPIAWQLQYFGQTGLNPTNLDSSGVNTILNDYQNSINPNLLQFSINVSNNYVNITNPPVQLSVAGVPKYIVALVDSTNFATTNWTIYTSSNLIVNLGNNQGWHGIWIGLRGYADTTNQAAWQYKRLKLDTTPPKLVITGPASGTVNTPMIQLTGFSPEVLSRISYDLTNSSGLVTNQQVLVLDQFYDTNSFELTTNTFQAFDIPLTNGINGFILHATDLAGNVTTLATNITLNYSGKTPPVVQIAWPTNGDQITGSNFNCRGWVSDPTATVTIPCVFTNGDTNIYAGGIYTNVYSGSVGRNGNFWIYGVPLNAGANSFAVTVQDVAGNIVVTNLSVGQSSLVLTINPVVDTSQLWQPTVSLSGTVSDATYAVWVNGVKGHNNGDGTWSASNIPVNQGGTANFDVTAYAPNEQQPDGSYGN